MLKKYMPKDTIKVVVDKSKKIMSHPMMFFTAAALSVYVADKTIASEKIKVSCKERPGF